MTDEKKPRRRKTRERKKRAEKTQKILSLHDGEEHKTVGTAYEKKVKN